MYDESLNLGGNRPYAVLRQEGRRAAVRLRMEVVCKERVRLAVAMERLDGSEVQCFEVTIKDGCGTVLVENHSCDSFVFWHVGSDGQGVPWSDLEVNVAGQSTEGEASIALSRIRTSEIDPDWRNLARSCRRYSGSVRELLNESNGLERFTEDDLGEWLTLTEDIRLGVNPPTTIVGRVRTVGERHSLVKTIIGGDKDDRPERIEFPPELIKKAKKGDPKALETFYTRVMVFTERYVGAMREAGHFNYSDCEPDAVAVGVARNIARGRLTAFKLDYRKDPQNAFLKWLRNAIRWYLLSEVRRSYNRAESVPLEVDNGDNEDAYDANPALYKVLSGLETVEDWSSRLSAVDLIQLFEDDPERTGRSGWHVDALRAYFLDGLDYKQVAERLGRGVPAVKIAIRRALERIKVLLGDD